MMQRATLACQSDAPASAKLIGLSKYVALMPLSLRKSQVFHYALKNISENVSFGLSSFQEIMIWLAPS